MNKFFFENGYFVNEKILTNLALEKFYKTIVDTAFYHLRKISDKQREIEKIYKSKKNLVSKFSEMIELYENFDKESLYQLQKLFVSNNEMRNIIVNEKFNKIFRNLLKVNNNVPLFIDGPGIFINRPETKRLLYKWHSESHYYPKRRNFLNVWIPIFYSKNEKNGTMLIKKKSHKLNDLPFNEYVGYDKSTEKAKNHYTQLEIPENFIKNLKTYSANLDLGSVLIFHRKAVHTSTMNLSKKYSFAAIFRVWDMSNDLTMSGDISATPYGNDKSGKPNIKVDY